MLIRFQLYFFLLKSCQVSTILILFFNQNCHIDMISLLLLHFSKVMSRYVLSFEIMSPRHDLSILVKKNITSV